MRLDSYRRREEAQIAERHTIKRRLRHGYRSALTGLLFAALHYWPPHG
jgi:hypothetical protein